MSQEKRRGLSLSCHCSNPEDVTPELFGQSCNGRWSAVFWRVPIFIWALLVTLWSGAAFWGPAPMFFLYMTHWGLLLILLESAFGIAVAAVKSRGDISDIKSGLPWYVQVYRLLYNIAIPVAFLITVFYWGLLKRAKKKVNYAPNPILDVMIHGVNSGVMLVELVLSAHPSRLLQIIQPLFFALVYMVFSVFYYLADGEDPWGNHFIYPVIDWSNPSQTMVVISCTGLFLALMHLVIMGIAALRDCIVRKCSKEDDGEYNKGFVA